MKSIILITISVVCSVVVVLGILNLSLSIENEKTQVFEIDLADANEIQFQYNQIMDELCLDELPPDSLEEFSELPDKLKSHFQKYSEKKVQMQELKTKMDLLSSKYAGMSESNYFVLPNWNCPYEEEWHQFFTKLIDVENNPEKYEKYSDNNYIELFWNLDECVINFNEKYGFEPCIERLQPRVELFCSKYSQENCVEITNQELLDWLNGRYPTGVN